MCRAKPQPATGKVKTRTRPMRGCSSKSKLRHRPFVSGCECQPLGFQPHGPMALRVISRRSRGRGRQRDEDDDQCRTSTSARTSDSIGRDEDSMMALDSVHGSGILAGPWRVHGGSAEQNERKVPPTQGDAITRVDAGNAKATGRRWFRSWARGGRPPEFVNRKSNSCPAGDRDANRSGEPGFFPKLAKCFGGERRMTEGWPG